MPLPRSLYYDQVAMDNNKDWDKTLLKATSNGNVVQIEECLKNNANINCHDPTASDLSALHLAVKGKHRQACRYLIEKGVDVNQADKNGSTALHFAAQVPSVEMSRLLLDAGAFVDARDSRKCIPLHYAADCNATSVCKILLNHGADVMATNNISLAPLHYAATGPNQLDTCKVLLDRGAEPDQLTDLGGTALARAASTGTPDMCLLFLEAGANVNHRNSKRRTPLHGAARKGAPETCCLLIEAGADIECQDYDGETPLYCAANMARIDNAMVLVQAGADINALNNAGHTLLEMFVNYSDEEAHQLKIEAKRAAKKRDHSELMKKGSKPIDVIKLFLVGDPGAGKTTLKKSLKRSAIGAMFAKERPINETSPHDATPGIEIQTLNIPQVGKFCTWDCAGQSEYHVTHGMFLGSSNSIFLLVYDITAEKQHKQLRYWLSFIKAGHNPALDSKPTVVLVATHADRARNIDTAHQCASENLRHMRDMFDDFLVIADRVILLDSHKSQSPDTKVLRKTLDELAMQIKTGEKIPNICTEVMKTKHLWSDPRHPVLPWPDFVKKVKQIDPLVDGSFVLKVANYLNDMGEIYHAKFNNETQDHVVLQPTWLCTKIIGPAFATDAAFPVSYNKLHKKVVYNLDELRELYGPFADEKLLMPFLEHLEIAYQYDSQHFIIPGMLPNDMDPVYWMQDDSFKEYYGRRVECSDNTDVFACSVFPCLMVAIMKWYKGEYKATAISKTCIKFIEKVEGIVHLTKDRKAIVICVRGRGLAERQACHQQLHQVLSFTLSKLELRSPGTRFRITYVSPSSLRAHDGLDCIRIYSREQIRSAEKASGIVTNGIGSDRVVDIFCQGYETAFLILFGLNCSAQWLLHETRDKIVALLDPKHPLLQDYRSLAEALGVDNTTLIFLEERCQRNQKSISGSLLDYWVHKDHANSTIGVLRRIVEHPGLVGKPEALEVLDKMLNDLGVKYKPEDVSPSVEIRVDEISNKFSVSTEVQLWRSVVRTNHKALRQDIVPSRILHHLHSLPIEEEEAIIAEEINHGPTKAADILLNALIRSRNSLWAKELINACRDDIVKYPHLASLMEAKYHEEKCRWCMPKYVRK